MTAPATLLGKRVLRGLCTALAVCASSSVLLGGDLANLIVNPSAAFQSPVREPRPLSELPKQVQAAEGKVTLWADYASQTKNSVPLYVVNRTGRALVLPSEDDDLVIKLEYDSGNGRWTRAQSHYRNGPITGCGHDSPREEVLPADHFFEVRGYRATQGEKHPVRYASHGGLELNSNSGEGLVSPADVSAVEEDYLTFEKVPDAIRWPIRARLELPNNNPLQLPACVEAVRMLPLLERNVPLLNMVRQIRDFVAIEPSTATTREAIQVMDKVLFHQWASDPSAYVPISNLCIQRILEPSNQAHAANLIPEEMAWKVLMDTSPQRTPIPGTPLPDLEVWKPLLAKAEQVLREPGSPAAVKKKYQQVLNCPGVVDSLVSDIAVIAWLKSPHEELQKSGAEALVRRSQMESLLHVAWSLPPKTQHLVLSALTGNWRFAARQRKSSPPLVSVEEKRFWKHCFTTSPLESLAALPPPSIFPADFRPVGDALRLPLRDFLAQEARRGENGGKKFPLDEQRADLLPTAIRILSEFRNPEDDSIMHELTKHQGTAMRTVSWNAKGNAEQAAVTVVANAASSGLQLRGYEAEREAILNE